MVQLDTKWGLKTVIWFLLQWTHIERVKPKRGRTENCIGQWWQLRLSIKAFPNKQGGSGPELASVEV